MALAPFSLKSLKVNQKFALHEYTSDHGQSVTGITGGQSYKGS